MIWYFLYPFRGTTEPPVLAPAHPLRRSFTRYATRAAIHPIITILLSVAIGAILVYPIPFLYTDSFGNGAANLPHHVWTAAQPFEGDLNTREDVVMRSVWIHGSYMQALEPHVLQTALKIQDQLLGPTVNFNPRRTRRMSWSESNQDLSELTVDVRDSMHAINGLGNQSWFFHSPLLYWSCSAGAIAEDDDILATVNAKPSQRTSVNVTLRHSIVFSGKRFEGSYLKAADALVITLIHKPESPVGQRWDQNALQLASTDGPWQIYPSNGRVMTNQLYEFRFQPLSLQDDLFLGIAYSLTMVYFLLTLSRLRAVKSRFGLTMAVVVQITISIMSSFTICAMFNINLSKIPREAYPLVVLSIGLENMFRLINAVLSTPSDHPTVSRISEALGKTGHVALAGVSQNLLILWMLSKVVSPGVAAFCTFAAIAIMFDFFYLLTYFVAVLSIDVRRMELSDSLHRASVRQQNVGKSFNKNPWVDSIVRGEAPMSTRIAGTLVMVGFVLIAQRHFLDEGLLKTFWRLFSPSASPPIVSETATLSADINQARTPHSWLRMQDHETAREVIQVIKPNAHSYLARVYDPLVIVLDGSDRNSPRTRISRLLPNLGDFADSHMSFFIITVLVIVAAVCLLMNYLLWDEVPESAVDGDSDSDSALSVASLSTGHAMDIVKLASSPDGIIVSVGLDRWIRVWDLKNNGRSYLVDQRKVDPFPILALAVDPTSTCAAVLSSKGHIMFWDLKERCWSKSIAVDTKGKTPLQFSFGRVSSDSVPPLLLVRHNGLMSEIHLSDSTVTESQLCRSPLVVSRQFCENSSTSLQALRVATASRSGCIHIASRQEDGWLSVGIDLPCPDRENMVISALPLPNLRSLLAIRRHNVELLDLKSHRVMHIFSTQPIKPDTLRCIPSAPRMTCCGSVGLTAFSLVYTNAETGECVIQTYTPPKEENLICFRNGGMITDKSCNGWSNTTEQVYSMSNPGVWETTDIGVIIGVRKQMSVLYQSEGYGSTGSSTSSDLRRRGISEKRSSSPALAEDDAWEVWMLSTKGESAVTQISSPSELSGQPQLLVSSVGPIVKVGKKSIVVAFGNVLKFIAIGTETFGNNVTDESNSVALGMTGRRRRTIAAKKRITGE